MVLLSSQSGLSNYNGARLFLNHIPTHSLPNSPACSVKILIDLMKKNLGTLRVRSYSPAGETKMALSVSNDTGNRLDSSESLFDSDLPVTNQLETVEQKRRFELLRLAFFVLKLRKLEQRLNNEQGSLEFVEDASEQRGEQLFRCNLLRHAIFQQVVTLIQLDSRDQAMQIIEACRK